MCFNIKPGPFHLLRKQHTSKILMTSHRYKTWTVRRLTHCFFYLINKNQFLSRAKTPKTQRGIRELFFLSHVLNVQWITVVIPTLEHSRFTIEQWLILAFLFPYSKSIFHCYDLIYIYMYIHIYRFILNNCLWVFLIYMYILNNFICFFFYVIGLTSNIRNIKNFKWISCERFWMTCTVVNTCVLFSMLILVKSFKS